MPKLRNRLDPVHVFAPAGGADSLLVERDQVVDVPGELIAPGERLHPDAEAPENAVVDVAVAAADAHTVRSPSGEVRAWSADRWELVEDPKPRKAAARGEEE